MRSSPEDGSAATHDFWSPGSAPSWLGLHMAADRIVLHLRRAGKDGHDLAALDAKDPLATHWEILLVLNAKCLAFADARGERLATAGADGVVDARQANVLDWDIPIIKNDGSIAGLSSGTKATVGIISRSSSGAAALGQEHSQR